MAGREIGHVRLGLDILEMHIRFESRVIEMEGIDKASRVRLARIAVKEAGDSAGVVYPVDNVPATAKSRERGIDSHSGSNLTLSNFLLFRDKEVKDMARDRGVSMAKGPVVWIVDDETKPPNAAFPRGI